MNNEPKFSDGEWTIRDDGKAAISIDHIVDEESTEAICDVVIWNYDDDDEGERLTGIANARLICAAPDLYAAAVAFEAMNDKVRACIRCEQSGRVCKEHLDECINVTAMRRAAIAKARGE